MPDDAAHARIVPSFWSTIVPIIFTTVLFSSVAFFLVGGPQIITGIAQDRVPQIEHLDLDLRLANQLMHEELGIANRQEARVAELAVGTQKYSSAVSLPSRRETVSQLFSLAAQKQPEVAKDIGRVAAFENVGFDWCQEWAKTQDRANRAELGTWQAAQDLAETYLVKGKNDPQTRDAVRRFNKEKLEMLSRLAEIKYFDDKIQPIATSEVAQAQMKIESLKLQTEYAQNLMKLSDEVIHMLFWLLALFGGLWVFRRIDKAIRRQVDRDQKVIL
jgi:hypothetical protein